MTIERSAKKISEIYMWLLSAVLLIIAAVIILEFSAGAFSGIDTYKVYNMSKTLGGIGAFLAFTAVVFFPIRKIGIHLKNRYKFTSTSVYKMLMKVTALIHPVIALFAFCLLSVHGFIFIKVVYNFDFSTIIIMGVLALTAITLLFITGSVLKHKLSRKRLRIFHFSVAVIFIAFFALHMLTG